LTKISDVIMASPERADETIEVGKIIPDTEPNYSALEAQLYMQVLDTINARRTSRPDLWPSQMLMLPQDEIEWGRIDQTERFAKIIKQAGFETVGVSDAVRWGKDGPQRLDDLIDYRIYGHVNQDIIDLTRASGDTFAVYTYPLDFVIGWAYHASKYNPDSISKWTYYWPLSRYYRPGKPNPSSGTSFAWPGEGGVLPSDYTFQVAEATRDAALIQYCQTLDQETLAAACLKQIQSELPLDIKDLTELIQDERLPRGNAVAWREILTAALQSDRAEQP